MNHNLVVSITNWQSKQESNQPKLSHKRPKYITNDIDGTGIIDLVSMKLLNTKNNAYNNERIGESKIKFQSIDRKYYYKLNHSDS